MTGLRGTLAERLWTRVDKTDTCWLWTGPVHETGYGLIGEGGYRGRTLRVHRVAYELTVGPIPDGLTLDHVCANRLCCNPAHLEPVTSEENVRRATARRTTCRRGHPFTAENTITRPLGRECRKCRGDGKRRRKLDRIYALGRAA